MNRASAWASWSGSRQGPRRGRQAHAAGVKLLSASVRHPDQVLSRNQPTGSSAIPSCPARSSRFLSLPGRLHARNSDGVVHVPVPLRPLHPWSRRPRPSHAPALATGMTVPELRQRAQWLLAECLAVSASDPALSEVFADLGEMVTVAEGVPWPMPQPPRRWGTGWRAPTGRWSEVSRERPVRRRTSDWGGCGCASPPASRLAAGAISTTRERAVPGRHRSSRPGRRWTFGLNAAA